jgi:hypothetical protein
MYINFVPILCTSIFLLRLEIRTYEPMNFLKLLRIIVIFSSVLMVDDVNEFN